MDTNERSMEGINTEITAKNIDLHTKFNNQKGQFKRNSTLEASGDNFCKV